MSRCGVGEASDHYHERFQHRWATSLVTNQGDTAVADVGFG